MWAALFDEAEFWVWVLAILALVICIEQILEAVREASVPQNERVMGYGLRIPAIQAVEGDPDTALHVSRDD